MGRVLLAGLVILLITALAGTAIVFSVNKNESMLPQNETPSVQTSKPSVVPEWQMVMTAGDVTSVGLTLKAETTNPAVSVTSEEGFKLEVFTDNGWQDVPVIEKKDISWSTVVYMSENGSFQWEIDWENIHGALKSGKYRISKKFFTASNTSKHFYAHFDIV